MLRRHPHVLIASDDIYEVILWTGEPFVNIAMACPDLVERTLVPADLVRASDLAVVNSLRGWRAARLADGTGRALGSTAAGVAAPT